MYVLPAEARHSLYLDMLTQLLGEFVELLVRLGPLLVLGLRLTLLRSALGRDHDHTGGSLCAARRAQLRPTGQVDIRDIVVFAEDGDVRDDVDGRDVCGENDDSWWQSSGHGRVAWCRLADCFDDFFDAALQTFLLRGCGEMLADFCFCGFSLAFEGLRLTFLYRL